MIEVTAVYSDTRSSGAPVVELRVGGGAYVHALIGMLAADPQSDSKQLAEWIAEATGLAIHPATYEINQQILASREREHMRDRQLSELQRRVREIWEASQEQDRNGHRWDRYTLMEWLHGLTTREFLIAAAEETDSATT